MDWPLRYAAALAQASGGELTLPEEEVDALLDLAREVAHGTERRYAPLSTYLAGRFVAHRMGEGVATRAALEEAAAVAARLLEEQPGGAPSSAP